MLTPRYPMYSCAVYFIQTASNAELWELLGCVINAPSTGGVTALHEMASINNVAVLELLVCAGGNPLLVDASGSSSAHYAAHNNAYDACAYLIDVGFESFLIKDYAGGNFNISTQHFDKLALIT